MPTAAEQQRNLRRRHRRERQAVVFGSLVAGLAVAGLGAVAAYTGALDVPFLDREFSSPTPEPGVIAKPAPCPPQDTLPVGAATIKVTVLNGGGAAGMAGTTANELEARGFTVLDTGNFSPKVPAVAQIMFGAEGVAAAYTLAAHIPDPVLVLDLREDATVDLVIGTQFAAPVPVDAVTLDPEVPLVPGPGCIPLDEALQDAVPAPTPSPSATATAQAGSAED